MNKVQCKKRRKCMENKYFNTLIKKTPVSTSTKIFYCLSLKGWPCAK